MSHLSYWGLIVEDFGFKISQAALQIRAGLWLQRLGELNIRASDCVFPLDGVLNSLRGEVIHDGVEAAVRHSDAEGNGVDTPHHGLRKATFQSFGPDERVEHQVDVVRDEAEAKYGQVHDDHAQDFGFVELPAAADGLRSTQRLQDHEGTADVEEQRDDEAHRLDEDDHFGEVRLPLLGRKVLEAVGLVMVGWRRAVQQEPRWETPREHQHPDRRAHDLGVPLGSQSPGPERVHDGEEPVHADAGEEEDAAVHVGVKQRDGDFAQHAPERPVLVHEIEDPQRQRADEQEVGHHQVYHVRRGLVAKLERAGEDVDRHCVCDEPHHEDDAENGAVQRVLEAVVFEAGGIVWEGGVKVVRGMLDNRCVQKSRVEHPGVLLAWLTKGTTKKVNSRKRRVITKSFLKVKGFVEMSFYLKHAIQFTASCFIELPFCSVGWLVL